MFFIWRRMVELGMAAAAGGGGAPITDGGKSPGCYMHPPKTGNFCRDMQTQAGSSKPDPTRCRRHVRPMEVSPVRRCQSNVRDERRAATRWWAAEERNHFRSEDDGSD
ncbi:hypothetical protein EYF80_063396 [Liparis tanakae]|uniref:Uncharacterized protein n=1 Tax=Liparis tanakae TaxID=230148 RepID=A0A4Z2EC89_9TELE|nr:hypothetical protein EYF80_063396 [Liparis tanakae]